MSKTVELHTSAGVIRVELDDAKAPASVENFLAYVRSGHYDGTVFHRVIKGFMVQGGGMDGAMKQKPTLAPIKNEANNGLRNDKYTLAMARTGDPHSATAQFFINVGDNGFLNFKAENSQGWGYAVFGRVVAGSDVVDRIEGVKTGRRGFHDDVPLEDVTIDHAVEIA
jgi:peptidyl-prolyl cis-trans isomerase B (cyclophilin B)